MSSSSLHLFRFTFNFDFTSCFFSGDSSSSGNNHSSDLDFFGLSSAPVSNNNNGAAANNIKSDQSNFFGADLNDGFTGNSGFGSANQDSTKMSKDSIMALFNKPAQQSFQPPLLQHQQQLPGFMTEMNQNVSSPFCSELSISLFNDKP